MTEARHLSDQQIQTILNGSEDLSETSPILAKHLDHCTHCQQRIQAMTADDWWWHDGRRLLVGAATNSKLEISQSGQSHLLESSHFELYDPAGYLVSKLEPANQADLLGQLDEYIVEKGGRHWRMGIVFKGHDTELNRAVAINFWLHIWFNRRSPDIASFAKPKLPLQFAMRMLCRFIESARIAVSHFLSCPMSQTNHSSH